jgi:hypothetical protein
VEFPQQVSNFHNGRKLAEIIAEQILVNRGLKPDELSAKPKDLNPVMAEPTNTRSK